MTPKQKTYELTAQNIIRNLAKRQMEGYYCPDRASAVEKALSLIPQGSSVAWGGSMTLAETGLMDAVKNGSYQVIDRDQAKTPDMRKEIYGRICGADFFLTSTNAITLDGQLVNIDGHGSRVAFLCFGPDNVLVLAGMNKVVRDVETGIQRVKTMAAPPNAVRLNKTTPCTATGVCADCLAPDCICSQIVITRRSAVPQRIKVILVGEELGY